MIEDLKRCDFALYAAMPDLASRAEFFIGGPSGNIAILKNTAHKAEELLFSGIFEIDRQDFFMGPEGGYMPANLYNQEFVNTKLACHLIAVQRNPDFATATADFSAVVTNIKSVERLVPMKKGCTSTSCIRDAAGHVSIRLNHTLFLVRCDTCHPLNIDPWTEKR